MYPIHQSPLYKIKSLHHLQKVLNLKSQNHLSKIIDNVKKSYRCREKKKKNGGTRIIEAPSQDLKTVQKRISDLLHRVEKPIYVLSPCKGKSHIHNALVHSSSDDFRKIDIVGYFAAVKATKVFDFFYYDLQCSKDIAWRLTELTTFENHLPTGAPSSPLLAFYSYKKMWDSIFQLVIEQDCLFTLYVDDLVISGRHIPTGLILDVKKKIHSYGLKYHKEKASFNSSFEVTGILIKKHNLELPSRKHKIIHEQRKNIYENPHNREKLKQHLSGYLAEPKRIKQLIEESKID